MKHISLRLNDEEAEKLDNICAETHRTISYILRSALDIYLDEYGDYQIALDRFNDKDDPLISAEELKKELGI